MLLSIEGNPFITRFKTSILNPLTTFKLFSIEGNPFITRFKTYKVARLHISVTAGSIEGNPFITRFKTQEFMKYLYEITPQVLKVIHL